MNENRDKANDTVLGNAPQAASGDGEAACQAVRAWLSDHLRPDGSSQPDQAVMAHLYGCAACRRSANLLAEIAGGLGALREELGPPPGFSSRVLARAEEQRALAVRQHPVLIRVWAAVGLLLILGFLRPFHSTPPPERGSTSRGPESRQDPGAAQIPPVDTEIEVRAQLQKMDGFPLPLGAIVHAYEHISLLIDVSHPCHVYAAHVSPTGSRTALFPESDQEKSEIISPENPIRVPRLTSLKLDIGRGKEHFYVIISKKPLDQVEPKICRYLGLSCARGAPVQADVIEEDPPLLRLREQRQTDQKTTSQTDKRGVALVHLWVNHV